MSSSVPIKISSKVRVRFAPSPTGYLHVGGARTALYNYLFAKHYDGEFVLRIEDTDQARNTIESLKMVIDDLKWLGLKWDEGPHPETLKDMGSCGPYKQSERLTIYKKHAEELIQSGKAYYCFLTDEELSAQRDAAMKAGKPPHVKSPYEDWSLEKSMERLKSGDKAVVRFKTKPLKKDYLLQDLIRGEVKFPSDMVGDFVLLRSDGMPVYNFCCVVDDYLMKISHVFRAEEHLPNTLRQLMIYEGLGWNIPQFGHVSLVLDEDRQKLSKRKGATSCHQFKEEGYLPEALKNFIALLGWSHPEGKEILSTKEMIASFNGERLNPAGAVFDGVKLKWMNAQHLRALPNEEIWKLIEPLLKQAGVKTLSDSSWQTKSIETFKTSMETLQDAIPLYQTLDDSQFVIDPTATEILSSEPTGKVLQVWKELIAAHSEEFLSEADFLKIQDLVKDKAAVKGKNLFQPIRIAVIGKPHGTELKVLVPLISKKSLIDRADKVIGSIKG
ncbi:MAG: glutamate--tRNA ligase [Bdellovibrionota bacterium]